MSNTPSCDPVVFCNVMQALKVVKNDDFFSRFTYLVGVLFRLYVFCLAHNQLLFAVGTRSAEPCVSVSALVVFRRRVSSPGVDCPTLAIIATQSCILWDLSLHCHDRCLKLQMRPMQRFQPILDLCSALLVLDQQPILCHLMAICANTPIICK